MAVEAPLTVEGTGFSVQAFNEGGLAYGNRRYVWRNVPAQMAGWRFTRTDGGVRAEIAVTAQADGGKTWTEPKDAKASLIRNTLALVSSPDLAAWTVRSVILYHGDVAKHGFQYVDWLFEGDDLIAASRTAYDDGLGGAHNQHDANYLTFHRIPNFRTMTMTGSAPSK